jgi:hypothetical protein
MLHRQNRQARSRLFLILNRILSASAVILCKWIKTAFSLQPSASRLFPSQVTAHLPKQSLKAFSFLADG